MVGYRHTLHCENGCRRWTTPHRACGKDVHYRTTSQKRRTWLVLIRVRSKYTVCVHDEPNDCEIKAVVQARVKNLDVREDVTRKIQHTLETTGLWIFQSPQPPSNDNCNGFVDACGVEKIVTVDLKERNGTLLNCGCFRPMPDDPPSESARRVPMPKAPEEPSSETRNVSTVTKIIEGPLKLTPLSFVTVI